MSKERQYNGGEWTPARYRSFVKGGLRQVSMRWPPRNHALREARVERGKYLCNGCKKIVPASIKEGGKRVKNVHVDHILPVIDPAKGFVSWDSVIDRMFCEIDNLQVLCRECHKEVTAEERRIARERKKRSK